MAFSLFASEMQLLRHIQGQVDSFIPPFLDRAAQRPMLGCKKLLFLGTQLGRRPTVPTANSCDYKG
jgi:hypothetical protein